MDSQCKLLIFRLSKFALLSTTALIFLSSRRSENPPLLAEVPHYVDHQPSLDWQNGGQFRPSDEEVALTGCSDGLFGTANASGD